MSDTVPQLDVEKVIDTLGGSEGLRATYEAYGLPPPSAMVVRKWRERGQIAGAHIAFVLHALLDGAAAPSINSFFQEPACLCRSRTKPSPSGAPLSVFE